MVVPNQHDPVLEIFYPIRRQQITLNSVVNDARDLKKRLLRFAVVPNPKNLFEGPLRTQKRRVG